MHTAGSEAKPLALCQCGDPVVEHDETGACHPSVLLGFGGPRVAGTCECLLPVLAARAASQQSSGAARPIAH